MTSGFRPAKPVGPSLAELLEAWHEPTYRIRQIANWKYRRLAGSYAEMVNIPAELRERLASTISFSNLEPLHEAQSVDGRTIKILFRLLDGEQIESVLMRQRGLHERSDRNTICVSSQAGCKMRCSFCATGHGGWRRNLSSVEIVDQVLHFARLLKGESSRVTHVVFMGMGEPLDNYDQVLEAVKILNHPEHFGLGARSITISTCGLAPQIERMAREPVQVNLAVSLAATTDEQRTELIPVNRRYPMRQLLLACDQYATLTHRRVSFEYVLIAGVNDSDQDAHRLAALMMGRLAHVNLIPLNPVPGDSYQRPDQKAVRRFERVLHEAHVPVSLRYSKGVDITAGCGQLRAWNAALSDPAF